MSNEFVISGKRLGTLKNVFIKILISAILGWVVYVLGSFADSIIGGSLLGEEALAAIEIIIPISSLVYFFAYIVSTGAGLLHAKLIGKNDFEGADREFSSGFFFSLVLGIVLAIALIFVKEPWLDLYELTGSIRQSAGDYYDPLIFFALILPLGLYIYDCVVSDGDIYTSLACDIVQTVLNIVLSLILVGSMGIKGLSIATVVSTFVGYLIPCLRFFSKGNTLHLKFKFSFEDIFRSMKLGSSSFITVLAVAVLDIIMNLYITNTYGASYVAPYAIVNFALEIASALSLVGQTMTTIMNFSIGEENNKDVKDILKYSIKVSLFVGLGFTVLFIACTPFWPGLFGLETEEFINYTKLASIAIGLTFIPQTFLYLLCSFHTAYEKVKVSIASNFLNSFIFPLICPLVLSIIFGYGGFVVGFAVSNVVTTIVVYLFLFIKNKKVFIIPENGSKFYSIDLVLDKDSISKAVVTIRDILKENKVSDIISNRVQLTVEESLLITLKNNKKKVLSRIVVDINNERVKLIVKDDGKVFNVNDLDQKVSDMSNFVFVMVSSKSCKSVNYITTNLNGNHYEFNL